MEKGETDGVDTMLRDVIINNKWNMNLINHLVLLCGAQRPQVYTEVQIPSMSDLIDMKEISIAQGFVQMIGVSDRHGGNEGVCLREESPQTALTLHGATVECPVQSTPGVADQAPALLRSRRVHDPRSSPRSLFHSHSLFR